MEARNLPPPGAYALIREVVSSSDWVGKSISVTGRLDEHDLQSCRATLVDPKSQKQLQVSTTLVEPFSAQTGSLVQFIGEVSHPDSEDPQMVILQARVARCVDGLDLVLYEKALKMQREFLASRVDR